MKKSEIYKTAQIAVLSNTGFNNLTKLELLRELMKEEDLALLCEKDQKKGDSNGKSL